MALFEETDVLCVADREGGRVECVQAGLQKPLHANRDDTGRRVVNYNSRMIGKPYAIAAKGTALLVLRGSPGAKGLTIDTAAEPEEDPIIDEGEVVGDHADFGHAEEVIEDLTFVDPVDACRFGFKSFNDFLPVF